MPGLASFDSRDIIIYVVEDVVFECVKKKRLKRKNEFAILFSL